MVDRYYPEAGIKLISDAASRRYDEDDLFVPYTDHAALEGQYNLMTRSRDEWKKQAETLEAENKRLREELKKFSTGLYVHPITGDICRNIDDLAAGKEPT